MPTFRQSPAPYQRKKKSTLQIMIELTIALAIVWIAAVVTTFIKNPKYGVHSIGLMLTSIAVTAVCDVLVTVLKNKKDKELLKKIPYDLLHSYSWVTAMIFTLCCPVWTRYYVIAVGSIFATLIGKHVFGGFGKNIFNPAAMGRIFIMLCFGAELGAPEGFEVADGITGATITTQINSSMGWLGDKAVEGYKILDLFTGNYFAAMGETFAILLVVLGIILAIRKDIQWRAPVFYIGTVAVSALVIGLVLGFRDPLTYMVYHLATGGLLFGAVFMITDPVTTPTSPFGNCLVGVVAGLLVTLMRVGTNAAEGVVYSLVVINLLSPMIDALVKGKTSARLGAKYGVTFGTAAVAVALSVGMAWSANGGREAYEKNGLTVEEYAALEARCQIDWISSNGYEFGKSETTPAGITQSYDVLDASGTKVGVVYLVETESKSIEIVTEPPYTSKVSGAIYVAFDINAKEAKGVYLVKGEKSVNATSDGFVNQAQSFIDDHSDYTTMDPNTFDGQVGATYSAKGLQSIVKAAYDAFAAEYGA